MTMGDVESEQPSLRLLSSENSTEKLKDRTHTASVPQDCGHLEHEHQSPSASQRSGSEALLIPFTAQSDLESWV